MRTNEIIIIEKHWPTAVRNRIICAVIRIKGTIRRRISTWRYRRMKAKEQVVLYAPDYLYEE